MSKSIYIDPSYSVFYENKLFDLTNPTLNRDDQLLPASRLKEAAENNGLTIKTADYIDKDTSFASSGSSYFSLGIIPDFKSLKQKGVQSKAFVLMEAPVVAPELYEKLPYLSKNFEHVFVHNTEGESYSLEGVDTKSLRKFYWPLPYRGVLEKFWNKSERMNKFVVINSHLRPQSSKNELYSKRIEAIAAFSKYDSIDLYGRGWDQLFKRRSLWLPYLLNYRSLQKAYRGSCESKYETLSNYNFCLCLENMKMKGYMTEKIFDCFYSGTIPLYLGAPDISNHVPSAAYIDCRNFKNWNEVMHYAFGLSESQIASMRHAGRDFMESERLLPYYNSMLDMVGIRFQSSSTTLKS